MKTTTYHEIKVIYAIDEHQREKRICGHGEFI